MLALVLLGVFVGSALVIVAIYTVVNRRRLVAADLLRARLAPVGAVMASEQSILKDQRTSQLQFLNRILEGKAAADGIAHLLERAGSRLSVGEFVLLTAVVAAVGFMVGQRFGILVGIPAGVVGATLPYYYMKHRQRVRLTKFEAQLPDAIDMLVNAMKAGYSFQAAMKFIGDEMPEPLGTEFARVYDEQRLGMEVRNALINLQERMPTLDTRMFVTALLLQRETGGNLAEIMSNLATLMRERVALAGHIDTLTAEPKLSAVVLALLPILLFVVISSLNREYIETLWLTPLGKMLLAYGVVSGVVGYFVLRKMADIDI